MSVDRDRCGKRFLHEKNTFPKSVVDVDIKLVKEIHFERSAENRDHGKFEQQILTNFYELYHADIIEHLFSHGTPAFELMIGTTVFEEPLTGKMSMCRNNASADNNTEVESEARIDPENVVVDKAETEETLVASKSRCGVDEVENIVEKVPELSTQERYKMLMLTAECESLRKQLFEKQQQLKLANDRISQTEDTNAYRREVIRLEDILHENERESADLKKELEKVKDENRTISSSLSGFITENTVLKNQIKLNEQIRMNDTRTKTTGSDEESKCEKCVRNECWVDELISSLDDMEVRMKEKEKKLAAAEYTLKDINELSHLLETIEKCLGGVDKDNYLAENHTATSDELGIMSGDATVYRGNMSSVSKTVHPLGQGYVPNKIDSSLHKMNHFHPMQYINNNIQEHQHFLTETQQLLPVKPGHDLYSDIVKGTTEKVSVFSTSITKGVNVRELNEQFTGDRINIHRFHGKKAHHFKHYIPVHMKEDKPDTCVIVAGGNDLPGHKPVREIANDLVDAAITCKNHGASKVIIGSVLPREDFYCQLRRKELNDLLKDLCYIGNFTYMDNWNMSLQHVSYDGVHLNSRGDKQLLFNLLWYLNA